MGNDPYFQYQLRVSQDIKLGANLVILAQICEELSFRQVEVHGYQSIPKSTGSLTMVFCIFCPNLVVLASIGGDLLDEITESGVNFDF